MSHSISIIRNGKTWNGTLDIDGDIFTSFEILKGISILLFDDEKEENFYCTHIYDLMKHSEELKIEYKPKANRNEEE